MRLLKLPYFPNMKSSKKVFAKVIPVEPVFLTLQEAYKYTGMEEKMFRKTAREYGLRTYARGPKKIWHKKEDLDKMLESFLIIKKKD
jgi:hypothetical protein